MVDRPDEKGEGSNSRKKLMRDTTGEKKYNLRLT